MTAFAFPRLTAAALAAALAVTGLSATPASAMNDRDRAALGLIVGLGVLAAIADANNDHRPPPPPRHYPPPPPPGGYYPGDPGGYYPGDYRGHHRRAEACTVRVHYDRYGRRVEVSSPGCNEPRYRR
ncbi:hypothetical protein C8J30_10290 [Rhodobacter viridis]|uniref:PXPV repeat-containing protein n=1 Tax=Rhodobacter viridis TaxID=1054202 RepID=A0A318U1E7_9RHOB|nr:hypothetical protein [Rhodobacter viridis]PYF11780.1 hypothetical protein C8J30_10290 [Rhodobacter viridis]